MRCFSARFRRARRQLGYTQAEMAELLGTKLRTVQHWEAGDRNPSLADLILEKVASLPKAKEPRAGRPGRKPRRKKSRRPED